ncbi:hypothetical protein BDD12DRAFT_848775 [Trichophaea hybrida]|nr:hypothetical protein BDD12DRAFT_848775 [Trichophaea hybrida]
MGAASLRQLYPLLGDTNRPDDSAESDIDVVFIHGLNPSGHEDHAERTWTHPTGTVWPAEQLPLSIPSARILLFSYNSNVFFGVSSATIYDHANSLLDRLSGKRMGEMEKHRPILFVCHSLGGLLIKQALVNAQTNALYGNIRKATSGLMFFGTPHCGGNGVALGQCVANILSAVSGGLQNSLLSTLKQNSVLNEIIRDNFCSQKEDYDVITFFETLPMKVKVVSWIGSRSVPMLIVNPTSAKLGSTKEVALELDADHSGLCKFENSDDAGYEIVVRHLRILREKALERYKTERTNLEVTLPLILHSYNRIRTNLQGYIKANQHLRKFLRDVRTQQGIYTTAVDKLLAKVVKEENQRTHMLDNPSDKQWAMVRLKHDSELGRILGDSFNRVMGSIEGVLKAIEDIENVLFNPNQGAPEVFDYAIPPGSEQLGINTNVPPTLTTGNIGDLERLCNTMTNHNASLEVAVKRLQRNSRLSEVLPTVSQRSFVTPSTLSQRDDEARSMHPRTLQTASKKLHTIVCKALRIPCQCHCLHLCLDNFAMAANTISPTRTTANFWFLLSKLNMGECEYGLPNLSSPTPYLVFTRQESISAYPSQHDGEYGSPEMVYQELALDEKFEKHFQVGGDTDDENVGFTLHRAYTATPPCCDTVMSLGQLISCSTSKFTNLGCYQIAAKLAKSILSFYASPWIHNWSLETIRCYKNISANNRDIYSLGLILLQLGLQCPDSVKRVEEDVLDKALWNLTTKMGNSYRQVVENCIRKWGHRGLNLMMDENLKGFESDIKRLEKLIEDFTPRPPKATA